uniref:histidine-tRNA synthetase n=1 Tax=Ahnfeltia fastigiata TaxID=31363 RepID=UPI001D0FBFD5|nr:histidine-tRNA synthetase [Ahnfeltia fastigiata]UAT97547.1 histidine-tRNA synthetase [Ahnfeltia fastigiata]
MQPLRGTRDILPNETIFWQYIYNTVLRVLTTSSYHEIRTPILESTSLFKRSIGNGTDIVNKEMYSLIDQGNREITLRPEGTASIARSFISNKLYQESQINRLWYLGPMFRYERPQSGRQRQFHQLGVECIGSISPMADTEVIHMAIKILTQLNCKDYQLEINSIGDLAERNKYKTDLKDYLKYYNRDLDIESQKRLEINPLRILDSKNLQTQEILIKAPRLQNYLKSDSIQHFNLVCKYLNNLNINFQINNMLVRGLDYYNYTAFEVKTHLLGSQDTICGGGRYDNLIKQLGGPNTPAVGWAIGLERLLMLVKSKLDIDYPKVDLYIATQSLAAKDKIWSIILILEKYNINFELDLSDSSFQKQLKRANKSKAIGCLILGENEIQNNTVTIKWLVTGDQEIIEYNDFIKRIENNTLYTQNHK